MPKKGALADFDFVLYHSPIKALDNIKEIMPDIVFINAVDFPRHWKTLTQFIRSYVDKEKTVIILFVNNRFTIEEADKALHIGVQAIINSDLHNRPDRLEKIIRRYRKAETVSDAIFPERRKLPVWLLFTSPDSGIIITGTIIQIKNDIIFFRPDTPSLTHSLAKGTVLNQCSLKVGDKTFSPECRVVENTHYLQLELSEMDNSIRDEIRKLTAAEE
ncbi:PilZ domain-containing protein [Brucepastera parasyntrophica]|uniref:PilZ domain-containing protein n=1 Tax=Brucepastera parasyntrophica TaxID=2880008 RepID=UPI00210D5E54|nr:PilZ domain-containing protein [Brucepastera parasyntrophica]ULQ59865.1 PilZ domain-containing protein [Brucepastera parasyntrophica]